MTTAVAQPDWEIMHQCQGRLLAHCRSSRMRNRGVWREASQTLGQALEEGAPQLLRRQFRWRGNIREERRSLGAIRASSAALSPSPAELLRLGACASAVSIISQRGDTDTAPPLIAVAQQGEKALAAAYAATSVPAASSLPPCRPQ